MTPTPFTIRYVGSHLSDQTPEYSGGRVTHMQHHTAPTKQTVPPSGGESEAGGAARFLRLYPTIILSRLITEERNR